MEEKSIGRGRGRGLKLIQMTTIHTRKALTRENLFPEPGIFIIIIFY